MNKDGLLYADDDPPPEDVKRAEEDWGDEIERRQREFEEMIDKEKNKNASQKK